VSGTWAPIITSSKGTSGALKQKTNCFDLRKHFDFAQVFQKWTIEWVYAGGLRTGWMRNVEEMMRQTCELWWTWERFEGCEADEMNLERCWSFEDGNQMEIETLKAWNFLRTSKKTSESSEFRTFLYMSLVDQFLNNQNRFPISKLISKLTSHKRDFRISRKSYWRICGVMKRDESFNALNRPVNRFSIKKAVCGCGLWSSGYRLACLSFSVDQLWEFSGDWQQSKVEASCLWAANETN
jgi:hypothetical protein